MLDNLGCDNHVESATLRFKRFGGRRAIGDVQTLIFRMERRNPD